MLAEKLTRKELEAMAKNFEATRKAGLSLLEWADTVRTKKVS